MNSTKTATKKSAPPKVKKIKSGSAECEDIRTSLSPGIIGRAFYDNLYFLQGRIPEYCHTQ